MFARAQASAPSVVFIDEIDALCPARDGVAGASTATGVSEVSQRLVATLLTLLDGADVKVPPC